MAILPAKSSQMIAYDYKSDFGRIPSMPLSTYLVACELGQLAPSNKREVVRGAHHLDKADAGVEV